MKLKRLPHTAFLLYLCGIAISGFAAESTMELKPEFRKVLSGSPDTPNSLAFYDYLGYVQKRDTPEAAEEFVIYTLRLPDTPEGRATARSTVAILIDSYHVIEQEILHSEASNLCSGQGTSMSMDQIYLAMDQQDDFNESIIEQQYHLAMSQFDNGVRELMLAELARHKLSFTYATYDHKVAWEMQNPKPNMADVIDAVCAELVTRMNNVN